MPALYKRSMAPIHSSRSGFTGFFIRTGMSTPLNVSAISCTAKGFAVVRAPIHNISMLYFRDSYTCFSVATSVATYIPVSLRTCWSHFNAGVPTPSNPPGFVRGFHTPALKIFTPFSASFFAVSMTCSSVSALHGPEIMIGRLSSTPGNKIDSNSIFFFVMCCKLKFDCRLPPFFQRMRREKSGYTLRHCFRRLHRG
ncbi:hypothetical protein SDC9_130299 [bioreactor metagenome]|uniref:Uncharacterized protein n=1 Tax=bioreactor metagenome TaxID=1076179 RepID=A0A645D1E8_9ZZZZ